MQCVRRLPLVLLLAGFSCVACQREAQQAETVKPLFDSIPVVVPVQPLINEVSGIADSKANPGFLWAQEDGGNPSQLYLVKHNGAVQKTFFISGLTNRDWEDMALAGGEIYLGEIGDNNATYTDYAVYKFPEPALTVDTVKGAEIIRFRYPDGPHDAEAFLVEPSTKIIYLITKRDNVSKIYKLTPPFSSAVHVAESVGQLPYTGVVSAALSPDAKEVIVKTYFALYHYTVGSGEKIEAALQKPHTLLPYTPEPQGEAVCFSAANNGYFTLSEKGFASAVQLFFYKRN